MSVVLLGVVLLVLLGAGAFAFALARSGKQQYDAQGQIVPGVASEAPASWAGAHTPEAKLHRRLGAAMRGLREVAGAPGEEVRLLELRVELEQQALEIDRRLIAASHLPAAAKAPALAQAEQAVSAVEQAAGAIIGQVALGSTATDRALADVTERIHFAAQAREELDRLEGLGSDSVGSSWPPDWATAEPADTEPSADEPDEGGTPQTGTA